MQQVHCVRAEKSFTTLTHLDGHRYQDETLALPRSRQSSSFLDKLRKRNTSRNPRARTRARSGAGPRGRNSLALRDHIVPEESSSGAPSTHLCEDAARRRPQRVCFSCHYHLVPPFALISLSHITFFLPFSLPPVLRTNQRTHRRWRDDRRRPRLYPNGEDYAVASDPVRREGW